jgi:D-tyrosyl-tRNA(Tyr) deacylase
MKVVLQRVSRASVTVDGEVTGAVGRGLMLLVGIGPDDDDTALRWMARKVVGLRIFPDDAGKMNLSLADLGLGVLAISQFTLYGDCRKGRRPSFVGAAHPDKAEPLYLRFCELLLEEGAAHVGRGIFGAHMDVELVNDGPVTLVLESP